MTPPAGSATAEAQRELKEAQKALGQALRSIQAMLEQGEQPVIGFIERVSQDQQLDVAVVQQGLWTLLAEGRVELRPNYVLGRASA